MSGTVVCEIDPPAFLAEPGVRAVLSALPEARLVGGCVRDSLADRPVADIDLATPRTPSEVIAALQAAGLRALPTGISHGTVTAIAGGHGIEVTTLRRDVQTDGRHAIVAYTDDWREDAARRDFTINALSLTPQGRLYDYFDGIADLRAGRIRFVGDPAARIAEDRLRVLRFFRFYARYALVPPDRPTLKALAAAADQLETLSAERIWSELKRILAAPAPLASLGLMRDLGILASVLPEAADLGRLESLLKADAPADPLLRLAALISATASSPAHRLRFSAAEADRFEALRCGPTPRMEDDDDGLRRLLTEDAKDVLIDRSWLAGAPDALRDRIAALPVPVFPLEGRDVLALGFAPGPAVGAALAAVRAWWRAGGCLAGREACLARLAELLK